MAKKSLTELNANYAGPKEHTLHATCEINLKDAVKTEAHKSGLTEAQAIVAATIYWVEKRAARRKKVVRP